MAYFKSAIDNTSLHKSFKVPMRTLQHWTTKKNDWRFELRLQLGEYLWLEGVALKRIGELFRPEELKALIACLNGSMPSEIMVLSDVALGHHVEDCALYEEMNVAQFGDVEKMRSAVPEKLRKLCPFERYVLLRWIYRFWESEERDLDKYVARLIQ